MKKIIFTVLFFFVFLGSNITTFASANEIVRTSGFFANPTPGVRSFSAGFIDQEGDYGYFVGTFSPSKMLRVQLKDNQGATINPVADGVLELGNINVDATLLSPSGAYAYAFSNQNSIIKIDVTNFTAANPFSTTTLKSPVIHPSGRYVYGLKTSPLAVQAIQLDASTQTGMEAAGSLSISNEGTFYTDEMSVIDSIGEYAYFVAYKQHDEGNFPSQTTVLDEQNLVIVRVGDSSGNPLATPERVASVSIGVDHRVKSIAISPDDSRLYVITAGQILPFKLKENEQQLDTPQAPTTEDILTLSPTDTSSTSQTFLSRISPNGNYLYFGNQSNSITKVYKIKLKEGSTILAKPEFAGAVTGLADGENGRVGALLLDPEATRLYLGININAGPVVTLDTGESASSAYTITYDANGGTSAPSSVQQNENDVTTLAAVGNMTRTGYSFTDWNSSADGSGTSYQAGIGNSFGADTTLYAQWSANSYLLTFNSNGGVATINNQSVSTGTLNATYAASITAPTATRSGYTFSSWSPSVPETMTFTEDTTFVAQWVTNNYTLSFDSAGGSSLDSVSYAYLQTVQTPTSPTRTGYSFAGWSPTLPQTMGAANQTLTAQWTANIYSITFEENGGSSVSDRSVTYNYTLGILPDSHKVAHRFHGWRIDQDDPVTSETLMPAQDITLSAIWLEKDYSDISIPTNMDEGEEATTNETVVQPSQTFIVPVNAKLVTQTFGGTGSVNNNGRIETNTLVVGGTFANNGILQTRGTVQVNSGGTLVSTANSHLIIHHLPSLNSFSYSMTPQSVNNGTIIADGILTVILDDDLPQQSRYTITLFDGAIESEFDTVNLPELDSGYYWDDSELYSAGVLHVVGSDSGLVSRPLNYPNPFKWNSGTYIGYELKGARDTELRVYTIRGQEILRKHFVANVDEGAKAGYNKIQITSATTFDTWSAGVYLYLLMQDGNIVGRGRMVVVP